MSEHYVKDIGEYLNNIQKLQLNNIIESKSKNIIFEDPGVPTICVKSILPSKTTPGGFIYSSVDYTTAQPTPSSPQIVWTIGDGTVNLESLTVCEGWASTLHTHTINRKLNHFDIIKDNQVLEWISDLVTIDDNDTTSFDIAITLLT
eukprot:GHVR01139500.1.p1 GENE.GHVR01139500.1~~GHVR01139500.1.p1  ORF type:complete len:166 (+),score=51.77 GHVR01139500.1:58-498(+)